MTRTAIVQFTSGEVTPEVDSRPDIEDYAGGCRKLENMIPDKYGNATRRPGTELIVAGNGAACYYEAPTPDPAKIGISTMADLAKIGNDGGFPLNGDYELLANLDATGITFWPIGINPVTHAGLEFSGSFDGNFFTISNMAIDDTVLAAGGSANAAGLFFRLNGATVENLTIKDMTIIGGAGVNFGAGLLANSSVSASVVTNTHVSGTISGPLANSCGGMFSSANPNMNICSANVTLSSGRSSFSAGGLVATFGGTATNCYAQGSIISTFGGTALASVGGLISIQTGTDKSIVNCYSAMVITGSVSSNVGGFVGVGGAGTPVYTSNYWDDTIVPVLDLDDIGDDGDVAGILKSTTGAMFQEATFINWDFSTIWQIDEGNDYPRFIWQTQADIREVCQRV